MTDFDENGSTLGAGERAMVAQVRATDPSARRVTAMFIAEDALEDQDLFAADMGMRIEMRRGGPADQGRVFREALVQRGNRETGHHALSPS